MGAFITLMKTSILQSDLVGVPVTVEDNNSVSSLQVEAQTSCPGAQQKDKIRLPLFIKLLQQCSTVFRLGCSCNTRQKLKFSGLKQRWNWTMFPV